MRQVQATSAIAAAIAVCVAQIETIAKTTAINNKPHNAQADMEKLLTHTRTHTHMYADTCAYYVNCVSAATKARANSEYHFL